MRQEHSLLLLVLLLSFIVIVVIVLLVVVVLLLVVVVLLLVVVTVVIIIGIGRHTATRQWQMKTNDETASTRPLTDDNNVPPPSKIVDKGGRRAAAVTSTTANTTVCSLPLVVACVCSFVVCFVCRGEGNNRKTMVCHVSQPHSGLCDVLAFMNTTGAKFMLILPTLRHHPLRAL